MGKAQGARHCKWRDWADTREVPPGMIQRKVKRPADHTAGTGGARAKFFSARKSRLVFGPGY